MRLHEVIYQQELHRALPLTITRFPDISEMPCRSKFHDASLIPNDD
jgi:hypothetical protein